MSGYSYHWPRWSVEMLKDVSFPCPVCDEGDWTVTLDGEGNEVGSAEISCSASTACENCYSNGSYVDALAEAIRAADAVEANGPTDRQLESMATFVSDADLSHRLQEARRFK